MTIGGEEIAELIAACRAGAAYSNALEKMQDAAIGAGMVDGTEELDRLLMDWHDKAHAILAKVDAPEQGQ
jgi:hypothetical protein